MHREKRQTAADIARRKGAEKIAVLTAYTAPVARLLDPHVDVLLVGDSLGMVVYGMENTLPVTPEMMIAHGRAVVNASRRALVVVDLPFGSYQASLEQAFLNAARVMRETGCGAVKLEGGAEMAPTVRFLVERGIPVMGHVGLMPQHVHTAGGFKIQGKTEAAAKRIVRDALAVQDAGAFSVVVEATAEAAAREAAAALSIPAIGIGASAACDGQVLVIDDVLGLSAHSPRFAKAYADLSAVIGAAAQAYAQEVRSGTFPGAEHVV